MKSMAGKLGLVMVVFGVTCGALALGQTRRSGGVIRDEIPKAALLTERGQQLAEQLRSLRRTEANLGSRHPSLKSVREKIAQIKEQLAAWAPRVADTDGGRGKAVADAVPEMNERDLRQLILRMSAKVDQLEGRVRELEKRLEVF